MQRATKIQYKKIKVDSTDIFYRECGNSDKPVILLLHGFPSSSRMFQNLMPLLGNDYHLIAPDYPGFGYSGAPSPAIFTYSFEHIAAIIGDFIDSLRLKKYHIYMQDYGGPIGFRIAMQKPRRVQSIIVQNAVIHEEGLSPAWAIRKAYWRDHGSNEEKLRSDLYSVNVAKARHVPAEIREEEINPDEWVEEYNFLQRPGAETIQMSLMYDYRKNVEAYPQWQQWLRQHRPPLLVLWGKFDRIFTVEGAKKFHRRCPRRKFIF